MSQLLFLDTERIRLSLFPQYSGHGRLDIAEKERQQLTPEMIEKSDLVIVIAEKEKWPDYLKECGKVVFWDIPDAFGMADDFAEDVYRQVRLRVEQLVAEIA